jgi:hypothetical protein
VLLLIVVSLPPGRKPFAVKINNNNIKLNSLSFHGVVTPIMEVEYIVFHQNMF